MSDKQPLGSTWYNLLDYSNEIRERTVVKSTSQTVWYRQVDWEGKDCGRIRQERKGHEWFPTKDEAIAELKRRLVRSVQHTYDRYTVAVKKLKDFNLKYAGSDCST